MIFPARSRPDSVLAHRDPFIFLPGAEPVGLRAGGAIPTKMEDFARPVAPERQVRKAVELFSTAYPMTAADCADAEKVEAFIRHISAEIGKTLGRSDFKSDRLNKLQRESAAIDLSRRRYNKLFRHLIRLERKVRIYVREQRKSAAILTAKR